MTYIETTHKKNYIVYLKIAKNNHPSVRLRYFRLLSNKLKNKFLPLVLLLEIWNPVNITPSLPCSVMSGLGLGLKVRVRVKLVFGPT